jgi:hypothetical protein
MRLFRKITAAPTPKTIPPAAAAITDVSMFQISRPAYDSTASLLLAVSEFEPIPRLPPIYSSPQLGPA